MALRSGSIRQANNPADQTNWNNSMAKAIEDAFLDEWPEAMDNAPKPEMNDQLRLMFVAVAKGVVKHLMENGSAFSVDTNSIGNHSHTLNGSNTTNQAGGHDHTVTTTISGTIDS